MKYGIFLFLTLSFLLASCKKDDPVVPKEYKVRYSVTWNGYVSGSVSCFGLKYNTDSAVKVLYSRDLQN